MGWGKGVAGLELLRQADRLGGDPRLHPMNEDGGSHPRAAAVFFWKSRAKGSLQ
jgi:hypothetical protein